MLSYGDLRKFSFQYADTHRETLNATYDSANDFARDFELPEEVFEAYLDQAREGGAEVEWGRNDRSELLVRTRIKAMIGRQVWGSSAFYPVIHQADLGMQTALEALGQ